ncbi:hypothetical protein Taro_003452 [Colocasia esculenta]|uniref:Uncharacterized protein n=1 Tax=Colocasia esculenta TaxID=4460 RepID=A0A843TLN7_COLES|nr:hypothetical protein [Colocasia esculenta]
MQQIMLFGNSPNSGSRRYLFNMISIKGGICFVKVGICLIRQVSIFIFLSSKTTMPNAVAEATRCLTRFSVMDRVAVVHTQPASTWDPDKGPARHQRY